MKLVFYEIKKVLSKRVFLAALVFCVVINLTVFYFTNASDFNERRVTGSAKMVEMIEKYSFMPRDKAREELKLSEDAYMIALDMNSLSNNSDPEFFDDELSMLEDEKKENPKAYALAEEMLKKGGLDEEKSWFTTIILAQLDYIDSYPSFIGEMKDRADEQATFSVFGDKNGFSYKNIYKTADDYRRLADTELKIGNDYPLTSVFSYKATDWFLVLMIFLLCFFIFREEREKGLYNLVRTSRFGKLKTVCAKLTSMLIITALLSFVMVFITFVMSTLLFGRWELDRPIQSIAEMRNCIFPISCDEFCLLFILGKILAMLFIAAIFAVVYILISNSALTHIVSFGIIGAEFVLYSAIPSYASFNLPKYINIFYFLSGEFFGNYLNLNIFGIPFRADLFVPAVFGIMFAAGIAVASIVFTRESQEVRSSAIVAKLSAIKQKHSKIAGSTAVIHGEFYKYLISGKAAVILLVILILGVSSSIGTVRYSVTEPEEIAYHNYILQFQGELTPEKNKQVKEYRDYFSKLENKIEKIQNDKKMSERTKEFAVKSIENILSTQGEGFKRLDEQYKRMKKLKKQGVDAQLLDEIVYPEFVSNNTREWNNLALNLLFLLLTIPLIYTFEYRKNMIDLLQATRNGRRKLFRAKLTVALLSAAFTFAAAYVPYFVRFISTFGEKYLGAPIICLERFTNAGTTMSLRTAVILETLCYFGITLAAVSLMVYISIRVKNYVLSTIFSAVIMFVPCLVIYSFDIVRVGSVFTENTVPKLFLILLISTAAAVIITLLSTKKFTGRSVKNGGK